MLCDFENKVIEDLLEVSFSDIPNKYKCTDKSQKIIRNKKGTIIPLIFEKENKYLGYENKIYNYYKNIDKYKEKGIDNVEEFLMIIKLRQNKLYGKEKQNAEYIQRYVQYHDTLVKEGFLTLNSYLEYIKDRKKSVSKTYLKNEYENRKDFLESIGVYSLNDYMEYNYIIGEAYKLYDKEKLGISLENYIRFETREFLWKKEYREKNNSLIGVQKYIKSKYNREKPIKKFSDISIYFKEPSFYYHKFNIKHFFEYYDREKNLIKIRHKYESEKIQEPYHKYLVKNIGKES